MKKQHFRQKSGIVNQPQRFHKAYKDTDGEKTCRVYFKNGGCSMLIFKGIKRASAVARICALKRMYSDFQGSFIIAQ